MMIRLFSTDGRELAMTSALSGIFDIADVTPGRYVLTGFSAVFTEGGARGAGARGGVPATTPIGEARLAVTVGNTDLENVALDQRAPLSIPGRVQVDGKSSISEVPAFDRMGVVLAPADEMSSQPTPPVRFASDGLFRAETVYPGRYWIRVDGRPSGIYLKRLTMGGVDLMREPFVISGSSPGILDMVLGSGTSQVEGTVMDKAAKPVPGVQVVMVPNEQRGRRELYRTATTDSSGKFLIDGFTPGAYKAFAWEELEPFSYFDSEVLKKYEQQGTAITVAESTKATVEVKVIPVEGQ